MADSGRGPDKPNTPAGGASFNHSGVPEIDRSALRDYAPSAAVDRVWRRLDAGLQRSSGATAGLRSPLVAAESRWQRRGFGWAIAVSAVTFGAGIWLGRHTANEELKAVALLSREPNASGTRGPDATRAEHGGQGRSGQGLNGQGRDGDTRDESAEHKRTANGERQTPVTALNPGELDAQGPFELEQASPLASDPQGLGVPQGIAQLPNDVAGAPLNGEAPALGPVPPLAPLSPPLAQGTSPSWQRFANAGEYETALFVLGQNGGFEKALAEADAEQLMLLSDVAWATGQRQRSISALRRVVIEFPTEPAAPLAAWSLAKQLEKVGDKQGALKAFADYRALSPEGDFAEDALVRQMKDAAERGDQARLKELAAQYELEFTDGRRAGDVARWLSRGSDGASPDAGVEALTSDSDEAADSEERSAAANKAAAASKAAAPKKAAAQGEQTESAGAQEKAPEKTKEKPPEQGGEKAPSKSEPAPK